MKKFEKNYCPPLSTFIQSLGEQGRVISLLGVFADPDSDIPEPDISHESIGQFVYSQASINLYTMLEATVKDLTCVLLKHYRVGTVKEVDSLKISYFIYSDFTPEERQDYLFDLYEKSVSAGLRYGVQRFESLLHPFGLSGTVDKAVSQCVYELAQIRNNLLHKHGIVDKQFRDACPWFNIPLRTRIQITSDMFEKYRHAVIDYCEILQNRVQAT
jgi:hypothetical protein